MPSCVSTSSLGDLVCEVGADLGHGSDQDPRHQTGQVPEVHRAGVAVGQLWALPGSPGVTQQAGHGVRPAQGLT